MSASARLAPEPPGAPDTSGAPPDASERATVVEVRAHDAPGLLHSVASAFRARGADVLSARVNTLGAEAGTVQDVTIQEAMRLTDDPAAGRTVQIVLEPARDWIDDFRDRLAAGAVQT